MFRFSLLFLAYVVSFMCNHVEALSEALRPMDYSDIVLIEKPKQVTISSCGRVAFIVQSSDIDKNVNSESVYVYNAIGHVPQKILELDHADQIFWSQNILYILGKRNNSYQIFSFTHELTALFSTSKPISTCVVDANRSVLYYTQTRYIPEAVVQQSKEEGYVYRWGKDHSLLIMGEKRYQYPEYEEIWGLDISTKMNFLVTALNYKNWNFTDSLITELQISEDSNYLGILVNRSGRPELGESVGCREVWIWDRLENHLERVQPVAKRIDSHLIMQNKTITFQQVDENRSLHAHVLEDVNTPPQVVVQDKNSGQITYLTSLNSHLSSIARGYVEPIDVVADECTVKGYLVHPVNKEVSKRYPLIIATYGFKGKTFIADAEWHSSFPAQVLANEGYYVLLLNHCGLAQNLVGNSQKAREIEGWNVLKVFERAIDLLDEKGIVQSEKVGIYGWSHGAFIVQFIISHSKKFHVACLGEGSDYGPSFFFLSGTDYMTKICDNIYGGPPWGETLKNYIEFSGLFGVDRIETPVLIESVGGVAGLPRLELYVPLRYLNIPTELVLYDEEEHNFVKPKARMASMARKVDWFNFWLSGKNNPEKPEQTFRWEEMRKAKKTF